MEIVVSSQLFNTSAYENIQLRWVTLICRIMSAVVPCILLRLSSFSSKLFRHRESSSLKGNRGQLIKWKSKKFVIINTISGTFLVDDTLVVCVTSDLRDGNLCYMTQIIHVLVDAAVSQHFFLSVFLPCLFSLPCSPPRPHPWASSCASCAVWRSRTLHRWAAGPHDRRASAFRCADCSSASHPAASSAF